uniref:Uncharacterized protein n=1 Tax=Anguilla anguilla TaxID=7936 RepID=A0A0E9QBJ9_ANGAN
MLGINGFKGVSHYSGVFNCFLRVACHTTPSPKPLF